MRFRERMMLWSYIGAINVLMPLGILLGLPILLLKEKRRKTLFKRLGFQQFPATAGARRPVWVHALSLGETLSCVSLIEELRSQITDRPIYFSVSTLSAMEMASERIKPFVDGIFYFPLDLWWPAQRAIQKISPCLMVFIETDIWPGFQHLLRRSRTPAVLVNGRLSPDSYKACSRLRSLFAPALNTFATVYPQSQAEMQRYKAVGLDFAKLGGAGNLKFDVASRTANGDEVEQLREQLAVTMDDVVLLAGSTHPGEEGKVFEAFDKVRERVRGAKLIVVPRHPERGNEVASLVRQRELRVQQFTELETTTPWDVLVVDAMGMLSTLYRLASVAFVGGSLVSKGGQNPLESAAAGCPVMFGSDMSDFPDIATWLLESGAAQQVSSGAMLGQRWLEVLSDADIRKRMRGACLRVVQEHQGTTVVIATEICTLLNRLENRVSPSAEG